MAQLRLILPLLLRFSALCCCFAAPALHAEAQIAGQIQLREQKRAEAEKRAAESRAAGRTEAVPNAALFGGAPFPASAAADAAEKQGIFSYVLTGGFIRIFFTKTAAEGRENAFYGAAELDLKPGWKTYWRNPGSSGLAPQIELDGGAAAEILFPAPQLLQTEDEWNYGYKNHIILPFRITLPANAAAAQQTLYTGSLSLGICEKVCAPQKLAFRFNTAAIKTDKKQNALLRQALAALPKAADKSFALISVKAEPGTEGKALELRLAAPAGAQTQLYTDGGDALQLGLAELKKAEAACPPAEKQNAKRAKSKAQLTACPLILTYHVPLLFGEAKKGAPVYYTAVSGKNAVSDMKTIE